MKPYCPSPAPVRQQGLSLIELMVALTVSLIILVSLVAVLSNAQKTTRIQSGLQDIQERGRSGLAIMVRDIRNAGFAGCSNKGATFTSHLAQAEPLTIRGFEHSTTGSGIRWYPDWDRDPPLPNQPPGPDLESDALVVTYAQRMLQLSDEASGAETSFAVPDLAGIKDKDLLYLSSCRSADLFQVSRKLAATKEIFHEIPDNRTELLGNTYNPGDWVMRHLTARYHVANNTDGTPTLFWSPSYDDSDSVPLVRGVENMQLLYGEDETGDNMADVYRQADDVVSWPDVLSVRIGLLVRSEQELGSSPADFNRNAVDVLDHHYTVGANSRFRRRLYTTTVKIRNAL